MTKLDLIDRKKLLATLADQRISDGSAVVAIIRALPTQPAQTGSEVVGWLSMDSAPKGAPGPDILGADENGRQFVMYWRTWPGWQPHQDTPGWYMTCGIHRAYPVAWKALSPIVAAPTVSIDPVAVVEGPMQRLSKALAEARHVESVSITVRNEDADEILAALRSKMQGEK